MGQTLGISGNVTMFSYRLCGVDVSGLAAVQWLDEWSDAELSRDYPKAAWWGIAHLRCLMTTP